ncbi:helix-turn-helix domain-containing protein [Terrabacter sp. 2RAF25]|uniref:helix-turn-helix domain-containing protein n=1 Tax=Terrabacter sp. 2RAF25 TaxID=3232998 RepID=UPI003F9C136A
MPDGLSPREAEVLALIAAGRSNTDIATRLVLSNAHCADSSCRRRSCGSVITVQRERPLVHLVPPDHSPTSADCCPSG